MEQVSIFVLTVYKNYGPKKLADGTIVLPKNIFTEALGKEKSVLYKIIYDFNSNKLIKEFFKNEKDSFIRRIWPLTLSATYNDFFLKTVKDENGEKTQVENMTLKKISKSLEQLAYDMKHVHNMEMPRVWLEKYPRVNHKMNSRKRTPQN